MNPMDQILIESGLSAEGDASQAAKAEGLLLPSRLLVEHSDGSLIDADTGEIVGATNDNVPCHEDAFPDHLSRPPGALGEMIDYIVATAPKPSRALATAAALVVGATLSGRRDMGPTRSKTDLFVLALAESAAGKQHPQDAGVRLLQAACEDRGDDIVGFEDLMSESALVNETVYRPHAGVFVDELGDLIAKISGPKAQSFETGIKKTFLKLWGKNFAPYKTPSYADPSRRGRIVHSPSLSMFGACTPGKFYDATRSEDRENGFLNRFLLIPELCKTKGVDPAFDYREVPDDLVGKLREIYEIDRDELDNFDDDGKPNKDPWRAAVEPNRREIGWASGEVKTAYDLFKVACESRGYFFGRSAEMAVRIATIVAVGRDWISPAVDMADFEYGRELAAWSAEHMQRQSANFIGDTPVAKARAKILRLVAQAGGRMPRTVLLQNSGFGAKDLDEYLKDMGPDGTGALVIDQIAPASGGKAKKFVVLTGT